MEHFVVVHCPSGLPDAHRDVIATALASASAELDGPRELWAGRAFEWGVGGLGRQGDVESLIRGVVEAPVDVTVRRRMPEGPRVLVADLESTVIHNEMLDDLAERAGVGREVAEITARAMNDELDFEGAVEERLRLLAGLPVTVLEEARAGIRVDAGARTLVATLKARGAATALVSGGFDVFADPVAADLGFDRVVSNRLVIAGARLAGRREGPLIDGEAKRRHLLEIAEEKGVAPRAVVAVGDGANDLPMLGVAGLGIAWRGKPKVAAAAPSRLELGDLTSVLLALGIPRSDWVQG